MADISKVVVPQAHAHEEPQGKPKQQQQEMPQSEEPHKVQEQPHVEHPNLKQPHLVQPYLEHPHLEQLHMEPLDKKPETGNMPEKQVLHEATMPEQDTGLVEEIEREEVQDGEDLGDEEIQDEDKDDEIKKGNDSKTGNDDDDHGGGGAGTGGVIENKEGNATGAKTATKVKTENTEDRSPKSKEEDTGVGCDDERTGGTGLGKKLNRKAPKAKPKPRSGTKRAGNQISKGQLPELVNKKSD